MLYLEPLSLDPKELEEFAAVIGIIGIDEVAAFSAETKRIAKLVRNPQPMTMERLMALAWGSSSLTLEEGVAGHIHALQIAMAALAVADEQPVYDSDEFSELTCTMCGTSRYHDPIHTDDCPWDILAKTVAEAIHPRR